MQLQVIGARIEDGDTSIFKFWADLSAQDKTYFVIGRYPTMFQYNKFILFCSWYFDSNYTYLYKIRLKAKLIQIRRGKDEFSFSEHFFPFYAYDLPCEQLFSITCGSRRLLASFNKSVGILFQFTIMFIVLLSDKPNKVAMRRRNATEKWRIK